ncbi:MAG: twin-arginine translocase TatA/TatE family subunit [Oscillospiraceae bacterium]|nr:twin-arginine translocase TatA/TatE family subunit [Oscillospiraceae bacterium]
MFGRLGMGELLLILAVVLIIFGPAKLPALAKSMGQAVAEFRKGTKEITKEFEEMAKEDSEEKADK